MQKQLLDALDFGKIMVAKMPEVNLTDLNIAVTAPAGGGKGGQQKQKKGGDGGGDTSNA